MLLFMLCDRIPSFDTLPISTGIVIISEWFRVFSSVCCVFMLVLYLMGYILETN